MGMTLLALKGTLLKKVEDEAKVCDEENGSGDEDVVNRRRKTADVEIANIYGKEDGMDEGTDFPLEFSNPLHGAPQTASEFLELVDANARMKSENSGGRD